jgi:PST family polysaccharide transporter
VQHDPRDAWLHGDDAGRDLKRATVRGGAATLAGQGARFALKFVSTVVLARLLTPADFGLVAMVTAVTGFIALFKDMGLSAATVQREHIDHAQVSTLFWVNVAASIALAALTVALAPALAWFYGEPRLTGITIGLAAGFLAGGLGVQHQALLRRRMRFRALALVEVTATAAGIAVAIVAARLGAGCFALVWMQVATGFTSAAALWLACSWRPGRPVRGAGVRPMLAFGGHLTAYGLTNYAARNADNLLIGWRWGAADLGVYARAYQLLLLPLQQVSAPITAVAVPALSRLQGDPARYRSFYLRGVQLLAWATIPGTVLLFVLAEEVVLLLLGEQWRAAVPVFRVLAVSSFLQPITSTAGWVYVSLGQADRMLRFSGLFNALIVAAFFVGLPWGPRGVAMAFAVAVLVLSVPSLAAAYARSPVTLAATAAAVRRPVIVAAIAGGAAFAARAGVIHIHHVGIVAIAVAAASVAAGVVALAWPGLRAEVRDVLRLVADARR